MIDNYIQALQKIPEVISETYKQVNMGPQMEVRILRQMNYVKLLQRIERNLKKTWPIFEKKEDVNFKEFCKTIFNYTPTEAKNTQSGREESIAGLLLEFLGEKNIIWCNPYLTSFSNRSHFLFHQTFTLF